MAPTNGISSWSFSELLMKYMKYGKMVNFKGKHHEGIAIMTSQCMEMECIGPLACSLDLLECSKLQAVFHFFMFLH